MAVGEGDVGGVAVALEGDELQVAAGAGGGGDPAQGEIGVEGVNLELGAVEDDGDDARIFGGEAEGAGDGGSGVVIKPGVEAVAADDRAADGVVGGEEMFGAPGVQGAFGHSVGGFGGLGAEELAADVAAVGEQFPPELRRAEGAVEGDDLAARGLAAFVVVEIGLEGGAPLLERGEAGGAAGLAAGGGEDGEEDGQEDGDDADGDEEFDEGET